MGSSRVAKNRGAVVARMLLAVVAVANAVSTSNFNTEVEKEKVKIGNLLVLNNGGGGMEGGVG